jgi:hypothetical protein
MQYYVKPNIGKKQKLFIFVLDRYHYYWLHKIFIFKSTNLT